MPLAQNAKKFLENLEQAKTKYKKHVIVCHNDADGICSAILATEVFLSDDPIKSFRPDTIIFRDNHELLSKIGKVNHASDTVYLYIDVQPVESGDNLFCIGHHKYKGGLKEGNFFIKSIPKTLPDANTVLVSFLKAVHFDKYTGSLTNFLKVFRKDKSLRRDFTACGAIGDNSNQLYEPNSSLLKFLKHYTKTEIELLRTASLSFTFEMSEPLAHRVISAASILSKIEKYGSISSFFNKSISNIVRPQYFDIAWNMDVFNTILKEKTEELLPRNVLILLKDNQKDKNNILMPHVRGIIANYFQGAKKLLIFEKHENGIFFSARKLSESVFLKMLGTLFDSFSLDSEGHPTYGWKPGKNEGGGYIFDPQPYIKRDYFSERAPSFLSKNNWLLVTVEGQVLHGNAKISVQPFKE